MKSSLKSLAYEKMRTSVEELQHIPSLIAKYGKKLENKEDLDPLIEHISKARYVLLGEASHGTHEYYALRMQLTKRLITDHGFSFIAVEGDWPDCYRVNRYVKGYSDAGNSAIDVLRGFNRWPTWMWANWEMVAFMNWLRGFNDRLDATKRVGFYGLDVYSLFESLEAIIGYLKQNDPEALTAAYRAMRCFEPYNNEHSYAQALSMVPELCEKEVVSLLTQIRNNIPGYDSDAENAFSTEQNALVAVNAEKYYQAMLQGGSATWNIRDKHMTNTLERLMDFHGSKSKGIVWAHNTHIGDARATDMLDEGMVNLGQLLTEKYADDGVMLVGFGSYKGTVIAGKSWGDEMKKMNVPVAINGSWERMLHDSGKGENKLIITSDMQDEDSMGYHLGHRAIGVVYHPEFEEYGNYVPSIIPMRYDAFIFLDQTTALHPLHIEAHKDQEPGTFPFGV